MKICFSVHFHHPQRFFCRENDALMIFYHYSLSLQSIIIYLINTSCRVWSIWVYFFIGLVDWKLYESQSKNKDGKCIAGKWKIVREKMKGDILWFYAAFFFIILNLFHSIVFQMHDELASFSESAFLLSMIVFLFRKTAAKHILGLGTSDDDANNCSFMRESFVHNMKYTYIYIFMNMNSKYVLINIYKRTHISIIVFIIIIIIIIILI